MRTLILVLAALSAAVAVPGSAAPGDDCEDVASEGGVTVGLDVDCTWRGPEGQAEERCVVYVHVAPPGNRGCAIE